MSEEEDFQLSQLEYFDLVAQPDIDPEEDAPDFNPELPPVLPGEELGFVATSSSRIPEGTNFKILFDSLPVTADDKVLTQLGYIKYIPVYQGTDPNSASTGLIDSSVVLAWAQDKIGETVPDNTYIMLDFENPFFHHIDEYSIDSEEFKQTTDELVDLVNVFKVAYPNAKIGHYGLPILPFWASFNGDAAEYMTGPGSSVRNWASMNEAQRELVLEDYKVRNQAIVSVLDWCNPSVYDRYDARYWWHNTSRREAQFQWAYHQIEVADRIVKEADSPIEILPAISGMYWKIGVIRPPGNFLQTTWMELLEDQIKGVIAHPSTNGLCYWHGLGFWVKLATEEDRENPGQGQPGYGMYLRQGECRQAFTEDYFNGVEPDWQGIYIEPVE